MKRKAQMTKNKIALCLSVKNAEDYILEWLCYHSIIGIDTFIIYDNMSTDRTMSLIQSAKAVLDIRLHNWKNADFSYQVDAYNDCISRYKDEFSWILFLDVDEFIVLQEYDSIKHLLKEFDSYSAIVVNWAMFGSSGHAEKPPGLVIENFTRRAAPEFSNTRHVKSFVKPQHVSHCINAHLFEVNGKTVDINHEEPTWEVAGIVSTPPIYRTCYINHYYTRSREEWFAKIHRGYNDIDTSEFNHERITEGFNYADRNEILDPSLLPYAEPVKTMMRQIGAEGKKKMTVEPLDVHRAFAGVADGTSKVVIMSLHGTIIGTNMEGDSIRGLDIKNSPPGYSVLLFALHGNYLQPVTPPYDAFTIHPASISGAVSLRRNDCYLCCYPDGTIDVTRDKASDWESFLLLSLEDFYRIKLILNNDLIDIRHDNICHKESNHLIDGFRLVVGEGIFDVRENLLSPSSHQDDGVNRFLGEECIALWKDQWKLREYRIFKPLVYMCAFGKGSLLLLRESLLSLLDEGRFVGKIIIMTDVTRNELKEIIGEYLSENINIRALPLSHGLDFYASRFRVFDDHEFKQCNPLLYVDCDVLFENDVNPMLKELALSRKLSAQMEPFAPLDEHTPSGAGLLRDDEIEAKGRYGFNSGVLGFSSTTSNFEAMKRIYCCIYRYSKREGRQSLTHFDQAIANYVACVKECFDLAIITNHTRWYVDGELRGENGKAGLIHVWGTYDKLSAMQQLRKLAPADNA